MYSFEWDQYKSKINQSKHDVTFEEAMTVFYDENALLEYDNLHSNDEEKGYLSMTKKDEYLEKEFNFEKAIKNPYVKELKRQVTININKSVIDYFKNESMHTGIPYQTLINLYLADCVKEKKKLKINWE